MQSSELSPGPLLGKRATTRYARVVEAAWAEADRKVFRPGWPARILNLCADGVALHLAEAFPEGTILTVTLYGRSDTLLGRFGLRVVRTVQNANGTWVLGANFLQPLPQGQLHELLA